MNDSTDRLRIDKWLWAARFFKTRSLAAQAVEGGRVRVDGERVKPAKELKPGDVVAVRVGELEWVVAVRALAARRGPAAEARGLYLEEEASRARREAITAARRLEPEPGFGLRGRPTKRDRRMLRKLTGD
ncbi:MAG TPA: RNA-binding S4 domain-containing protein [Burkholderiales bacterium]|nr:RNA-binding S4 domain-containing protein [Burkholderiales bacterium]